jgi:hypothetical protein
VQQWKFWQEMFIPTVVFSKLQQITTRHSPPATGRDDDINKLKQILDDTLIKTDHISDISKHEKIVDLGFPKVQQWKFWQEMFIPTVVFSKLQQITSDFVVGSK